VQFEIETHTAATAIADRDEVYEALANIIDNAIKYAPGSSIRVESKLPHDGIVEIAIADEGPGIPPKIVKRSSSGSFAARAAAS